MCRHFFQHRWWIHGIAVLPSHYSDSQEPLHDSPSQAHCKPLHILTWMTSLKIRYWRWTICYSPFVILLIMTVPKVLAFRKVSRINPKWLRRPVTHTGDCKLAHHEMFKWKRSWAIHNTQSSISVEISLHLCEKEGRGDLTTEKSLSVYKSFVYREWLSSMFLIIRCFLTCVFPDWFCSLVSYTAAIVAGRATGNGQPWRREEWEGQTAFSSASSLTPLSTGLCVTVWAFIF